MALLELSFASKEDSLSVRRFTVREAMSSLFEIFVWARSPNDDIDLASIVGKPASLRIAGGLAFALHGARLFSGVCSYLEQEQAEETGLSTYHLRIVPALWLLTQRSNHRIFQHLSAPEIVGRLLEAWGIEARWHVRPEHHPKLEYRVQYGESDLAFLNRILEEAGISFTFSDDRGAGPELVFSDAPHAVEARVGGPIRYADNPNQAEETAFVTKVRVSHAIRPGKVTVRDHDFRLKTGFELVGEALAPSGETRLEQHHYQPSAFLVEGHKGGETPVADDRGVARTEERVGKRQAEARLASEEAQRNRIAFGTNVLDLRPGSVFSIANHPRANLAADKRLLVTELSIEGTHDGAWTATGQAVFAAHPFRPARTTPIPRIHSVESAIVVGPRGEEIHTDEFGRVRVQFHWDREGAFDDESSCWMRVSQGWAGGGFGMMALPRVGHEVLIGFIGGDPDQPVVVGRVFNNTTRTPYKLPDHKTRSTWKSDSSPGSEGFNEIMFEDAKGAEIVYMQAERNLEKLVKVDETITVGKSRATTVGEVDETAIGIKEVAHIKGSRTGREMVAERISFTTGEATITLEGPNITLKAAANILLNAGASILANAGAEVTINGGASITVNAAASITVASGATAVVKAGGGDLVLQGGPMVKINPGAGVETAIPIGVQVPGFEDVPIVTPPDVDIESNVWMAEKHAKFDPEQPDWFWDMVKPGGDWDFTRLGSQYEEFSALHYGMVGAAAGYPLEVIMRQAGRMNIEKGESELEWGTPGNGLCDGIEPYGNDPRHQEIIKKSYGLYDSRPNTENSLRGHSLGSQRGMAMRRLSNIRDWEFYQIVNLPSEQKVLSVAMRPNQEFRRTEYLYWNAEGTTPVNGSLDTIDSNNARTDILRQKELLTVIKSHNSAK